MGDQQTYSDIYDKLARTTDCVADFKRSKDGELVEISFTEADGEVEWSGRTWTKDDIIEHLRDSEAAVETSMRGFTISQAGESAVNVSSASKEKGKTGKRKVVIISLLFLAFVFLPFMCMQGGTDNEDIFDPGSASSSSPQESTFPSLDNRYAHSTINIREGRGTGYAVATQANRGDRLQVAPDSSRDGWTAVFQGRNHVGYVSESVLEDRPLPRAEIADWNWRSRPDFGTSGTVEYTVSIRNNTDQYIDRLRVNFESYDASDRIITTAFAFVRGIPPGGTASTSSYATYFGREESGRISIDQESLNRALR